jgi:hypothetical protein
MTTHDQHTPLPESDPMQPMDRQDFGTGQAQPSSEYPAQPSSESAVQPSSERMSQPGTTMDADVAQHDSTAFGGTDADANRGMTDVPAGQAASGGNDHDLFADDELAGLRARWDNVQASFVDDPKECVQKADGLVADLVEQLTRSFSHSRSQLEEQWARGEDASTEDLRITLKRYREFFDRLLAV